MTTLGDEGSLRYLRQVTVREIGVVGQERLLHSSAAIVGAGGLGSPALLYLAAAGVGHIAVIDSDALDITNLQRQIAHRTVDLGTNKAESAARAASDLNPTVRIEALAARIDASNALELLRPYDVILDCLDNFSARYVLNDAAVLLGTPLVSASVMRFQGQLRTVVPRKGACLRCLMPVPPAPGEVPTCAQSGIIGPVAGALGCLQAAEAIKVLLGLEGTLIDRMFALDALSFECETLQMERDTACPVCGDHPSILEPIDSPEACV